MCMGSRSRALFDERQRRTDGHVAGPGKDEIDDDGDDDGIDVGFISSRARLFGNDDEYVVGVEKDA